jgi:hypothetical protein
VKRGIVVLLGLAGTVAVLAGLGFVRVQVSGADNDPQRIAEEFGMPDGRAWRWSPPLAPGSGMAMAIGEDNGHPCILYHGAGYGGGTCFQSGWAVEAEFTPAVNGTLVVGFAIPETATVRFGRSRDALQVPVVDVPGRPHERYFALVIPTDGLSRLKPNDIVALDGRGRLLGRQHYNDGHDDFGANDGLYDRKWK